MNLIRNILFLLTITAVFSCSGSYDKRLAEIDSLTVNRQPQRALQMLDSMESEAAEMSEGNRMYFQLLRIKARDKAYIDHKTDSGVKQMVEYFESHDSKKAPEAYYYAGSVYRDLSDAPQAVEYFKKTISAIPDDGDMRLRSNAYYQCGDMFYKQQLKRQSLEMLEESFRCDSILKDTVLMMESLTKQALCHGIILKKSQFEDVVLNRLRRVLELAKATGNQYWIDNTMYKFAYTYSYTNKYDKVDEYLPLLKKMANGDSDILQKINCTYLLARKYIAARQYDEALPYCEYLKDCYFTDYRRYAAQYLFKIYASKGDFAKANAYIDQYEFLTDSMMVANAQNATAQADALYNYQLRERENLSLKAESQQRLYMLLISCAVFAAAMLIFWVCRIKHRQEKQRLCQQVARLSQLERMQREQNENLVAENSRRMDELEIARLSAQVTAARQDLVRQKLMESEAYQMLQQRIEKNKPLKDSDTALLDETVNRICEGFKSTLYSAYNLSAQEYAVCLLLKFELSVTDISRLVGRSSAAITQARKRLFIKLFGREGSANELDTYIRSL